MDVEIDGEWIEMRKKKLREELAQFDTQHLT